MSVLKAGICGTDLALVDGHYAVNLPRVLGHEWVGLVEAVGSDTDTGLVGARVVGEINYTCLSWGRSSPCAACRRGLVEHCLRRTVCGIIDQDGAWASHLNIPVNNLYPLPMSVTERDAVFVEPVAAALQTFERAPVYPGETVVVLGAGRLGALVGHIAALKGARVMAVARHPASLQRARRMGARAVALEGDDLIDRVREFAGPLGADTVVDTTGDPAGLNRALDLVRPRGTVCLKTTCGRLASLDATRAVVNEIQISTSRCGSFSKAIALMHAGKLKLEPLQAGEFGLDRIDEAIAAARAGGKILLDPAL